MIIFFYLIAIIVVIIIGYLFWDKRYKKPQKEIPPGYHRTGEINIDPVSGEKSEVYYNDQTGERLYIKKEK